MGAINRDWHAAHRMPQHPSKEQRARWHFEHAEACGCRAPSASEAQLIEEHRAQMAAAAVLDNAPEAVQ